MPEFAGSTLLITGGTGALGRAITRLALQTDIGRIRLFSRHEHEQAAVRAEFDDSRIRCMLGDVRDAWRMDIVMRGADYVIHAAAVKRIEACEYDPHEAVATNVLGTENVIRASLHHPIKRMLFVSTDKACNPITLYGYTKGCAERLVLAANAYIGGPPRFLAVRYGNVANSTGSVIPLWRQQAERGDPLTITDPAMTRYWITLEEAAQFVLNHLTADPGRIYVPAMPSFRLLDLAHAIAPPPHPIRTIGIREIEKQHEDVVGLWERNVVGMPPGSRSDRNTVWLSIDELRAKLGTI